MPGIHRVAPLFVILLVASGACNKMKKNDPESLASRVTTIADEYLSAHFQMWPEEETFAGVEGAANDRLADISADSRAAWELRVDGFAAQLDSINPDHLPAGSAARVTLGFLSQFLHNSQGFRACRTELWNVSPTWTGWQSGLAVLANSQPVGDSVKNAAAIKRFAQLPRYLDQEIANLREGIGLGYTAPRGNVSAVIAQMTSLLDAPVDDSPFVQMAPDSAAEFRNAMRQLERDEIRPAITRYRTFLENEYLAAARTDIAVSANPGGADCYRAAVRYHATIDMGAEDVHRTGLEQMSLIRARMREIAQRSFGTSDVSLALNRLRTDRRYLFSSRQNKLNVARDAIERARTVVPQWFGRLPQAQVEVQAVPAFNEASAPDGFYTAPAEDGSRPGVYYINLYKSETNPRAGLESTAFHETYPGHHLQGSIAMERKELHPVSRYFFLSGFGEGWALYSEELAEEMGLFSTDVDRIGMLSAQAMRAARLVVDAGMHALGWSREQAIEYMLDNTAESEDAVASEIDRYIAVPGQATSYMLGALEIRRLRSSAEQAMGASFDIKAFHDAVLEDGSVPLMMLRQKIETWIEGRH